MLIIGLLLIVAATAVTVGAVYDGGDEATVEILGRSVDTTVAGVFFAGAATMLLFLIGVWMIQASFGRARRRRAERKELKTRHRDSVEQLEQERTALRAENERLSGELAGRRTDPASTGTTADARTAEAGRRAAYDDGRPPEERLETAGHETSTATPPAQPGSHQRTSS